MQLIEAYERLESPIVSIHEVPPGEVVHYGILSGIWEDKDETILKVKKFIEKPTVQYAEDFLGTVGKKKERQFFSVFGQYILTPSVFKELEENITFNRILEKNEEFGLTESLAALIDTSGLFGVVLNGKMFDMGNTNAYRKALQNF